MLAVAVLALIVLGPWTYDAVEQSVKKKLEVKMDTILKADVKALAI